MRLSDLICERQSDTPLLRDGKEGRAGRRNNLRKKPGCHVSKGKKFFFVRGEEKKCKTTIRGKFVGEKKRWQKAPQRGDARLIQALE